MLVFTAAVATPSCLLFALIPALRSLRVQPLAAINGGGGRGMTLDRDRFSIHRLLTAIAACASFAPGWRSTRIDPMRALRED